MVSNMQRHQLGSPSPISSHWLLRVKHHREHRAETNPVCVLCQLSPAAQGTLLFETEGICSLKGVVHMSARQAGTNREMLRMAAGLGLGLRTALQEKAAQKKASETRLAEVWGEPWVGEAICYQGSCLFQVIPLLTPSLAAGSPAKWEKSAAGMLFWGKREPGKVPRWGA